MDDTVRDRLASEEMDVLRKELQGLKECQIKFLNTAPLATGLLFGFPQLAAKVSGADMPLYLGALLPLLVLIPAWWTFFDKARSITRIVGYYRVLEAMIRGEFKPAWFPGWERALEAFRRVSSGGPLVPLRYVLVENDSVWNDLSEDEKVVLYRRFRRERLDNTARNSSARLTPESKSTAPAWNLRFRNRLLRIARVITLRERQRYWLIAYSMFLWLSVLAVLLSAYLVYLHFQCGSWHWVSVGGAGLLVVWSAWCNARGLSELMWGANSYPANQLVWVWLLSRSKATPGPTEAYMRESQSRDCRILDPTESATLTIFQRRTSREVS